MSDIFALDEAGNREAAVRAAANPVNPSEIPPGFLLGLGEGTAKGIMRGGARTADFMQTVGAFFDPPGTDKEWVDKTAYEVRRDSIDYWTPKAGEVGTAGKILGAAGEMILPLMAGGGNPALLMGTTSIETGKDLVDAGVSAPLAATVGTIQAAATGFGFKIPVFGSTLTTRLATGAGGNLALGAAARKASQQTLEAGGYDEQAHQFDTNWTNLSVDALSGLLFGGLQHLSVRGEPAVNPKLPQEAVDSILTARNAKSFQDTTAPGAPDGHEASIAHQDALTTAFEQLSRNEPVSVGDAVARNEGAEFTPDGRVEESVKLAEQVARQVAKEEEPVAPESDQPMTAEELAAPEPRSVTEPDAQPAVVGETTPDIQALHDLAAQNPDVVVHSGYDENGAPVKTTAAEEATRIQLEYQNDLSTAKAYEVAVRCFFGSGA